MTDKPIDMWAELEKAAVRRERLAEKFLEKADELQVVCNLAGVITRNRREVLVDMHMSGNMNGYVEGFKRYEQGRIGMKQGFERVAGLRRRARGLRLVALGYRVALGLGRGAHPFVRMQ